MTPLNPFIIEGYAGDKYFCDRKEETETLITALKNGRNVTLISPRRMGKSGLIHHAFAKVNRENPEISCYYIDLFHTHSLQDFINTFANAIFGTLDTSIEKLYKQIVGIFRHCRPAITPDNITGMPTLTLSIDPTQEIPTIQEIFDYLRKSEKRIFIAFDEFQQIMEYPAKGVEALLRSHIQLLNNVNFIFAGSKKHMMQEMFYLPSRPFYQSTQTLSLKEIAEAEYSKFASNLFAEDGKELPEETFHYIYDTVNGHTWYVQYWLSRIYEQSPEVVTEALAQQVLSKIMAEEDDNFYTYYQLLTSAQRRTITGIAKAKKITSPISAETIAQYGMGAPSTVRSNLQALADKELILNERDNYEVYNRFFGIWLASR